MVMKSNTLIVSNNSSDLSFHIYPPINLNSNEQHEIGLVGLTMYNIDNTNNVITRILITRILITRIMCLNFNTKVKIMKLQSLMEHTRFHH